MITFDVEGPIFFSQNDEEAFFEWMEKIQSLQKWEGVGSALRFNFDMRKMDEDSAREILAIFYRYNLDMRILKFLDVAEFASWFRYKNAFWYGRVFEGV